MFIVPVSDAKQLPAAYNEKQHYLEEGVHPNGNKLQKRIKHMVQLYAEKGTEKLRSDELIFYRRDEKHFTPMKDVIIQNKERKNND